MYLMCIVMCLAISTMLAWQLWSVAAGETAVENYDHEYYRKVALSRGEVCLERSWLLSSSDTLADLPKLLRPRVRSFIAPKTSSLPILLLQKNE
jgi:hypothetical protein